MLEQMRGTPWASYPQPEWNTPGSLIEALSAVQGASDAESSHAAYDRFLYAVGNYHAGTYYPVLLATLPFLEALLQTGGDWPQRTVLCVLDDLIASFQPEPGYACLALTNGREQDVANAFSGAMHCMQATLEDIRTGGGANASLAHGVLDLLVP